MRRLIVFLLFFISLTMSAQIHLGTVKGKVFANGKAQAFVSLYIKTLKKGATTNAKGEFVLKNIPYGEHKLEVSFVGFENNSKLVQVNKFVTSIDFNLKEDVSQLNQLVLTGTRTFKRKTKSPVIVNVLPAKAFEETQSCNISEGLKFQPGLRVETDCQTCNYTQLRMNGLGGSYSQILINGRPIFSPLTGLYGLEQIPANMVDRIEVVRGGGSALYGSSAIGGTVNVMTKIPEENAFEIGLTTNLIDGKSSDNILSGNASVLSHNEKAGATFFINNRTRELYDNNGDNFSELPELRTQSFGVNMFFLPTENQKLETSISKITEYRYGGEMVDKAAHLAQQSEERTHHVLMGTLDYQINFNEDNSSLITYLSGQKTRRKHYTGIIPDGGKELEEFYRNPPYGSSDNKTFQAGVQLNHRLNNFIKGTNVLTLGTEFVSDDVNDIIEAYNYKIDQKTNNLGAFLQSDWELNNSFNVLTGVRVDKHNFLSKAVVSPRVSLLYRIKETTQIRATWGTGFRAPQAFDTDLHISFAGGGISRVSLADNLKEERSNSFSGSINYDKAMAKYIAGFTLEGFHTRLFDAFYQHPTGKDAFGETFEKRNGDNATVQGVTLELRANYNQKAQIETGVTFQKSEYDTPVENIEGLPAKKEFLRTPNQYGFATFTYTPSKKWNFALNAVYTGKMDIVHFAGAPEQKTDQYKVTPSFMEFNARAAYNFPWKITKTNIEVYGGVKNIFNAYQSDFDSGKNRDSNYIYGPGAPRTFYLGLKLRSL
jgi:outer membrane receptor for ferrienterochelin and colicins